MLAGGAADGMLDALLADRTNQFNIQSVRLDDTALATGEKGSDVRAVPPVNVRSRRKIRRRRLVRLLDVRFQEIFDIGFDIGGRNMASLQHPLAQTFFEFLTIFFHYFDLLSQFFLL